MSEWAGIQAAIDAEELSEERAAVDAIKVVFGLRQGQRELKKQEDIERVPLDNYFRIHPDVRLDDELRVAFMRSGGMTTKYDAPSAIRERNPALYRRLEELGCFRIDSDRVADALVAGWITPGDIEPYRTKGERNPSLIIEEKK